MASASSTHGDDNQFDEVDADPLPQRRLTSSVWSSFKKVKKPNGEMVAICNHCSSSLVGDGGTSHLRKHLKRKHGELIANLESSSGVLTSKFNQERSRKDLATMIIKHNYPLSIVDHHWFRVYSHGLNPEFNIISRNTIRSDIISVHKEEKEKLYAFLEKLSCKWWKLNSSRYPVLAKMARDILAAPATAVASESAFSVGGRKIDETRSSMLPELVEALVTIAD